MRNIDCQVGEGWSGGDGNEKYEGHVRHTISDTQCQKWSFQDPHKHDFVSRPEDYCRNGEERDQPTGAWCYTLDKKRRWEYCPVRRCSACDTGYFLTYCRENQYKLLNVFQNVG